jgi:putative Holliday junction resolvase
MTYLGLDIGSKTIGIAKSDSGIIAYPHLTLRFQEENYDEAYNKLKALITLEKADLIVIGLPKHMNNDIGIRGEISQKFYDKLKTDNIEAVLWDERLSTKLALKTMIEADLSRKKQKAKKDELAATLILQNYLDYK